jgi:hypothetical protein
LTQLLTKVKLLASQGTAAWNIAACNSVPRLAPLLKVIFEILTVTSPPRVFVVKEYQTELLPTKQKERSSSQPEHAVDVALIFVPFVVVFGQSSIAFAQASLAG